MSLLIEWIQCVILSFDDFSIKRKYKEKTVRIIKISLDMAGRCARPPYGLDR